MSWKNWAKYNVIKIIFTYFFPLFHVTTRKCSVTFLFCSILLGNALLLQVTREIRQRERWGNPEHSGPCLKTVGH
jgi:hypothetical protein